MADPAETQLQPDRGLAAFIDPETRPGHIVDIMIEERCPSWVAHWSWPAVRPVLFWLLGYRKAIRWADEIKQLNSGQECFAYLDKVLGLRVTASGMDRVPRTGRSVIVANHPTGLADGSIVLAALSGLRPDIEIMANADACRSITASPSNHSGRMGAGKTLDAEDARNPAPDQRPAFANGRVLLIFVRRIGADEKGAGWWTALAPNSRIARSEQVPPITPLPCRRAQFAAVLHILRHQSRTARHHPVRELLNRKGDRFTDLRAADPARTSMAIRRPSPSCANIATLHPLPKSRPAVRLRCGIRLIPRLSFPLGLAGLPWWRCSSRAGESRQNNSEKLPASAGAPMCA
ncbi:MAG: hypothetical protein R3C46_02760 [Hyphomonadaceae bacterium]